MGYGIASSTVATDTVYTSEDIVVQTTEGARYIVLNGEIVQLYSYDMSDDGFVLEDYESVGLGLYGPRRLRILHNDNIIWDRIR